MALPFFLQTRQAIRPFLQETQRTFPFLQTLQSTTFLTPIVNSPSVQPAGHQISPGSMVTRALAFFLLEIRRSPFR